VTAAEKEGVDLLIAGALEGKDVASRSFLGAVARPLAKLARCSLLLLTHPQIGPNPFRRIVVITDFSDCAKTASYPEEEIAWVAWPACVAPTFVARSAKATIPTSALSRLSTGNRRICFCSIKAWASSSS
jgi:hypothetical protein